MVLPTLLCRLWHHPSIPHGPLPLPRLRRLDFRLPRLSHQPFRFRQINIRRWFHNHHPHRPCINLWPLVPRLLPLPRPLAHVHFFPSLPPAHVQLH